jgi:hypothetical protein
LQALIKILHVLLSGRSIVPSFSGGAVGVVPVLMLVQVKNIKVAREKKDGHIQIGLVRSQFIFNCPTNEQK